MTLVRQYLRDYLYIAVGYYLLLQIALAAAIFYWPNFRDNIPAVAKLVPFDSLRKLVEGVQQDGYWPYFCVQQFFKGCGVFGLAAAALFGSGLIAREADNRTAELLLSRPLSRRRILLVRWATAAALLVAPVFLSTLAGVWLSGFVDEEVSWAAAVLAATHLSLFLIMLLSFTTWLSAGFTHQLKAGVVLIGLMLLQFALYLVKVMGDYTLFAMIDHDVLMPLSRGRYPALYSAIFAGASALFVALALRSFEKRDF